MAVEVDDEGIRFFNALSGRLDIHLSEPAQPLAKGLLNLAAPPSARLELLAPKKIRVNAIAPGSIEFPGGMWEERKTSNPQLYKRDPALNPVGPTG